jgi:hypothetical protein
MLPSKSTTKRSSLHRQNFFLKVPATPPLYAQIEHNNPIVLPNPLSIPASNTGVKCDADGEKHGITFREVLRGSRNNRG